MSKYRGGIEKILQLLRIGRSEPGQKTITYIGEDKLGNKYFESQVPDHMSRKNQRFFTRPDINEETDIVDLVKVQPAWEAWLRFKRKDPPTEEELQESEDYYQAQQALAAEKARVSELQSNTKKSNGPDNANRGKLREQRDTFGKRSYPKIPLRTPST